MTRKFWMAAALALALVGGVYAQDAPKKEEKQTTKKKGKKKKSSDQKGEAPAAPAK